MKVLSGQESTNVKAANRLIFDKNSRIYSKKRRVNFTLETAFLLKRRYELASGDRFKPVNNFLDLGCGSGLIVLNLKSLGFINRAYGCDISFGMLKECQNFAETLKTSVFLAQSDAENLPFKDSSFDLVIGHAILHHLPEIKKALREVYRVLKPQGRCIFTEPSKKGSKIIAVILWFFWFFPLLLRRILKSEQEKKVEINNFSAKEIRGQAIEIGFHEINTAAFAGFSCRIFYWLMDPISQKITSQIYRKFIDSIISALSILDAKLFSLFIPADWFDEFLISMKK